MPYVTAPDGASLFYRASGGGTPALLLVHGFGGDGGHWRHQVRPFGREHRIIRIDQRGHGRSDAPHAAYDIAGYADDLHWLIRELGLNRPVVVGHSMGGSAALQLAADRPDAVRGLVMIDSLISWDTRRDLREAPPSTSRWPFMDLFHPGFDRAEARRVAKQAAAMPAHVRRPSSASVFSHDSDRALRALRVPALFVAPDHGRSPEQSRRALGDTGVWFGQAVGSGHYVMLEVPDQFNAMLRRFLREIAGRRRRGVRR